MKDKNLYDEYKLLMQSRIFRVNDQETSVDAVFVC